MKKIFAILLVMTMSMSLFVGCGGNDSADSGSDTNVNQETDVNQDEVNEIKADVDLYGYVAPTELGEDLSSLTFRLEGVYYQLPIPVSVFLENGWEIPTVYQTEELIPAGEYYDMVFENAEGKIIYEVRIKNATDEPQKVENCLVNRMLIVSDQGFEFELPQGIAFNSTVDELKAVTEQGSIIQNGNYTTCTWDNEEWTDSITAWYHPEVGVEYFEMMNWE